MVPFTIIQQLTKNETIKLTLRRYFLQPLVLITGVALVICMAETSIDVEYQSFFRCLLVAFILFVFIPLIMALTTASTYKKSVFTLPVAYTFTDNTFDIYFGNGTQSSYKYSNIIKTRVRGKYVSIYLNKYLFFIINADRFSSKQLRWILDLGNSGVKSPAPISARFKKLRLVRLSIIAACVLFYVIVFARLFYTDRFSSISRYAPSDYSSLFNVDSGKAFATDVSINNKIRNSIALFTYKDRYSVLVYKIGRIDRPLPDVLETRFLLNDKRHLAVPASDISTGVKNYKIYYAMDSARPVARIIGTFSGDSVVTTISNDSVISYCLLLNNFNIKYKESGKIDIQYILRERDRPLPVDVMFLRTHNDVYLLTMSPTADSIILKPYALRNLLK